MITVTYDTSNLSALSGANTLTFTPTLSNGTITWACAGTVADKYLPASCR